jgi:amino acid transporter
MITMNQLESGHESHLYDAVRIIFGAALLCMGLLMAIAGVLGGDMPGRLLMVLGVAVFFMAVGAGMLARQPWSRWGFYFIAAMTVLGAAEAALRAHVLARNIMWDRPIALAVGLFFAWGLWMLSRHEAKEGWVKGKG